MSTTGTWAGLNRSEKQKPPNLTEYLARRSVDEPGWFKGTERPRKKKVKKKDGPVGTTLGVALLRV